VQLASFLQTKEKEGFWRFEMKLWLRFLPVLAVFMIIFAFAASSPAQQAGQDAAPAPPHRNDAAPTQQSQENEAHMPASGSATTQEAKTFTGRIAANHGSLVLKDPITKVTYKLSDSEQARGFVNQQVKVTGKLDRNSDMIQVERVEALR
jgi:hypothetical protein